MFLQLYNQRFNLAPVEKKEYLLIMVNKNLQESFRMEITKGKRN